MDSYLTSITTFNCRSIKKSIDCVRGFCKKEDIISLQETWLLPQDIPFLGEIDQDFQYTGKSAMDTGAGILRGRPHGGVALLWRKSIFDSVSIVQCNSVRIAAVKIAMSSRKLLVISVYMPIDHHDNLAEFTECLGEIAAIVQEYNVDSVFILGDFNAHPGSRFGEELNLFCGEQRWRCADIELLGRASGSHTYVSDVHFSKSWLDHCVVSEAGWKVVVSAKIHYDVYWSDHFPLEIKCNFNLIQNKYICNNNVENSIIWGHRNQKQIELYRKLCTNKLLDVAYPEELVNCSTKHCCNPVHKTIIDNSYLFIVKILREASNASYTHFVPKKNWRVVGWNRHVKSAHQEARQGFQNWVLYGRPKAGDIYNTMIESRKVFKVKLKWCQDNAERIKLDIIASHHKNKQFGKFWKETSKLSPRSSVPASVDGRSESAEIAELFKHHFKVEPTLTSSREVSYYGEKFASNGGVVITAEEVRRTVKGMTRGKSPGHDSLSVEHLQHAGDQIYQMLAMLFTACISHSYLPEEMIRTLVIPIVKNRTGDMSDKKNYRPISLATIMAKVLDSMLEERLNKHVKLHDAQFGFRPGLSTEAAVLCLKHTVRYYTIRKTPIYACFLDLSKAFDLVSYSKLWEKLSVETTLPGEQIRLFQYWYENQNNMVRWAGALSSPFRLECGVRQGGLTSPRLFSLYINRLIEELSNARVGCSIDGTFVNNISYADDMVLLSPSIGALRKLLSICERYAEAHGLRYNADKSELLVFKAGKHQRLTPPVTIRGTPLKVVTEFKYLGHWVTADLNDDVDVERERRALAVRSNMLIRRFARCTREVKMTLFRAYCQTFYTCSLWIQYTKKAYNVLRVQYNNAFRALLGLSRYCSASGMFAEAGIDGFHAIIRKRVASLWQRVRDSPNSLLRTVAERCDGPILKHWTTLHVGPAHLSAKM